MNGLSLNVSNSLFQLVEHLSFNLQKPLSSVFQPHFIVTQTMGMNNWLKIQIANHLGIAANCQFLKPNDIITQVYYLLDGPHERVLSIDSLQWLIFGLLDDPMFKRRYATVAQYYDQEEDIKRMALAEKVADLFDQYQIYRPEMINEWNAVQSTDLYETNWQKYLWIETKNKLGGKIPDKTRIGKFIIESLKNPSQQRKLKERIPKIEFFGISIITVYHLEIFNELAKYINISFNLLNPAPSIYWFEDKSALQIARWNSKGRREEQLYSAPIEGNALLTNWGRVIQDTFGLFFKDDDFLNEYQDEGVEPQPKHLLGKLQHDIYNNSIHADRNKLSLEDLKDGSLKINACYTPVREVEALYNYLVSIVSEEPGKLSPRDIVVMVSEINVYAPYIKAIFKTAPYSFPYTIADESLASEDGLIGALHAFLSLSEESFKAEDVLQLLEWSYIQKRFKLSNSALIRKAVDAANIRFGIQGNLTDDTVHVSWVNGLNRIMYGICMISDEEYMGDNESFYPLNLVEGDQSYELIRFTHFVNVLIKWIKEQHRDRTLLEWGDYILQVVSQIIFQSDDEEDEDNQLIIKYVQKLNSVSDIVQEKISFQVFKHNFLNSISAETKAGNFASGGITFCSLIPMRSIPFKIVALLGLGFDKFPRKETPINFNMMQQKQRRGDRNIKENDKHLFLETILSAQEHLYISYIGRNTKDNSFLPPSAIIDELIDYIINGTILNTDGSIDESFLRNELVIQHPLHNFSKQSEGTVNYLETNTKQAARAIVMEADNDESVKTTELSIHEFIKFFKNPFEHYYNKTLNIYYREEDILLRETEYFELDKLQEWKIKQDFLFLKDDELSVYIDKGIKQGLLPLKNISKTLLTDLFKDLEPIKKMVQASIDNQQERSIQIACAIGGTFFSGPIDQVFGDRVITVSFSKNSNKYRLEAYIKHLFAIAQGEKIESHFISYHDQCVFKIDSQSISRDEAINKLNELLSYYQGGDKTLFVFYPAFENNPDKLSTFDFKKYRTMFMNVVEPYIGVCNDQYILNEHKTGFFDNEDVFNEYLTNSERVMADAFRLFIKE